MLSGNSSGTLTTAIAPTNITIDLTTSPENININHMLGSSVAPWNGPDRLTDPTFLQRTISNSTGIARLSAGAATPNYGWYNTEMGTNLPNIQPRYVQSYTDALVASQSGIEG